MAKSAANAHAYGDTLQVIATAPLSAAPPTAPPPTALPPGWYDLGWIDDNGLTENQANAETKHFGWQGGAIVKTLRYQAEHTFEFIALEENPVVLGLYRRSQPTTVAGTNETQTVSVTGTPTAGTFPLVFGGQTATIQYNSTAAQMTAALTALSSVGPGNVSSSGGPLPATPIVVTFQGALGSQDASSMTVGAGSTLAPGGPATVATTIPGVNPVNTLPISGVTSQNIRQFAVDLIDGPVKHRLWIPLGEVTPSAGTVYQAKDLTAYNFLLTCYPDAAGNFVYDINNNPQLVAGAFA